MTHLPLTFEDKVFAVGDKVRVMRTFYPHLTEGEVLEVTKYEPSYVDRSGAPCYKWPAYVTVQQGDKRNTYHAHRFEKVEAV